MGRKATAADTRTQFTEDKIFERAVREALAGVDRKVVNALFTKTRRDLSKPRASDRRYR